jgi:hypothetical protein
MATIASGTHRSEGRRGDGADRVEGPRISKVGEWMG